MMGTASQSQVSASSPRSTLLSVGHRRFLEIRLVWRQRRANSQKREAEQLLSASPFNFSEQKLDISTMMTCQEKNGMFFASPTTPWKRSINLLIFQCFMKDGSLVSHNGERAAHMAGSITAPFP